VWAIFISTSETKIRRNLLLSLFFQLSAQSEICCDILLRLHTSHKGGRKTSSDGTLTKCLKRMLSFTSQRPIFLVMDECPNNLDLPSPRKQVLELVKDLVDLHLSNLQICVASRPEDDIRAILPGASLKGYDEIVKLLSDVGGAK
jgi:hypothetical protein